MTIWIIIVSLCRFLNNRWYYHPLSISINISYHVINLFIDQNTFIFLQKVEFLEMFDLTTLAHREEMMEVKRKKRRRMLRERSPSPPAVQNKRPTPTPLLTRFTPEDMNNSPELEDKKRFLTIFSLNHITQQQRRGTHSVYYVHNALYVFFFFWWHSRVYFIVIHYNLK